jgi:CHAT domain-containing protein
LQNPEYATFLTISPLTLREAQSKIPADVTVVSYFTTPSVTLAFVISRNSLHVSQIHVDEAQLSRATTTLFDFASDRDDPPSLKSLHNWLISPIQSELKTSRVAIVPYGVLHDVPFAALSGDGKSYLGDEHTVFMMPSVSALPLISARTKPSGQRLLVFANDQSEGLPRLRHAYDEATEIASLYNTRAVLGDAAAANLFTKTAGDYDLVHLIAHIEHDKQNPELVRIVLGRDHGNSVSLDTEQLLGMELRNTDLVVLSGCQSEMGRRTRGDDILGLSRALIYAGSRSVIASLWSVDDEATRPLMVAFYRHLREGQSKADALRAAQTELRQKYPNPYYWAGFVLTGDPGPSDASRFANEHR